MVDPRIYRGFLIVVAFAVIVCGFSLQNQPHALSSSIAGGNFFTGAGNEMSALWSRFPDRAPGSAGDNGLAAEVASQLQGGDGSGISGFNVQTSDFTSQTAVGSRTLETVTATRQGLSSGTIVVISHRDAAGSPPAAGLSGTAVMLELAHALSGETLNRSVMLISTSGQLGAAGATHLAESLGGAQVDAVILLGDLAGAGVRSPVVIPWSATDKLAPPVLRRTLGDYVAAATGIANETGGLAGQFARLAFPFAITEQAPFAGRGLPAVLLSVSGDRPAAAGSAADSGSAGSAGSAGSTGGVTTGSATRAANLGTAVLQTVNALDQGPPVAAPSSYLVLSGKLVPLWAVQLLGLALLLPVAATTLDALARTRRRGHTLGRWIGWVLTGAIPFVTGLVALLIARAAGVFSATPPGAVGGHAVTLTGGDAAALGMIAVLMVASYVFLRPACLHALAGMRGGRFANGRKPESPAADAAAVALSAVMCVLAVVVWALNPYAALLLIPALHFWLWLAEPRARSHRWVLAVLVVAGVIPLVLLLLYYANAYGLSPIGMAWSLALMQGGAMPVVAALYWSVALGCLTGAIVIAVRAMRAVTAAPEQAVTVRGPASYAGPGSLGGTKSALRR
ncbi:MAG: M28 family peptidase [Conexibacteraceae bacterium]|nr:M28 family peptidase [Conexibacteraceae bacterium]